MRGLIGDLLDAGRIGAGTFSVASDPSGVAALVARARSTFLSASGRHTVLIDLLPDLPRVMADRPRNLQVLSNLLSNAARHSPHSAPIRVADERDGAHVAVPVRDEGRGVAPERLPPLFRKYAQGPAPGRRAPGAARPPRVLMVDDDPQVLRYVRDALTAAGYAVAVTGDHAQLSRTIRLERPHVVLLDLVLPGADGIALMGSVPELADLPVVFISGYGRDETIAWALKAGAADYLVKPFSPTELTARVGAALRRVSRPEPFALGELAIHYEERRVTVAGREVELTATEHEILRVLSLNAGRVVANDALVRQVWSGRKADGNVNLVRNFVKKLRRKLGDDAQSPAWIFSVRGVGYRMPKPLER